VNPSDSSIPPRPSSAPAPYTGPVTPPGGRGGGRSIATMIAIGCGGIVLLGLLAIGGVAYWALSAQERVPTRSIITGAAAGYLEIQDLNADPFAREFLEQAVAVMGRAGERGEALPDSMKWLESMRDGGDQAAYALAFLVPHEASLVFSPSDEMPVTVVAAVNPRSFTRPLARMLRSAAEQSGGITQIEDVDVALFDPSGGAALMGGTLVFANDRSQLAQSVRRLRAAKGPARASFAEHAKEWPIFAEVAKPLVPVAFAQMGLPPELVARIEHAFTGIKFRSADGLLTTLDLQADSPEAAVKLRDAVAESIRESQAQFDEGGLKVNLAQELAGSRVESRFEVDGLLGALERSAERAAAERRPVHP